MKIAGFIVFHKPSESYACHSKWRGDFDFSSKSSSIPFIYTSRGAAISSIDSAIHHLEACVFYESSSLEDLNRLREFCLGLEVREVELNILEQSIPNGLFRPEVFVRRSFEKNKK